MQYPVVRQQSKEDCGAACLATVAKFYGRTFSLTRTREAVGTGHKGTTLLGLRRGAESLGFNARHVKASPELVDRIEEAPLPAMLHWKGRHWVVLYGMKRQKYIVADPAHGLIYLSRQQFMDGWRNYAMLLLVPDEERFYQQPNDTVGTIGRFLRRVRPYRNILLEAIAINVAIGLLALAMPVAMQLLTDDVLVRRDKQLLFTVATVIIGMNVFRTAIGLAQAHLIGQFGQRLQLGLTLDYGYKLLRLPLSYFDARRSGEVVSRLADVRLVNQFLAQLVLGLPSQLFIALISVGLMFLYSWQLTLASMLAFGLVACLNLLFLPVLRQKSRQLIVESSENQGFLVETFRGAMVLKTTSATPQAWDEYQLNFGRLANIQWIITKIGLYSATLTQFVSSLTTIGLLWLGSYFVIGGQLSIGQLIAFNGMSSNFLGFLALAVSLIDEFVTAQVAVQRLSEVLEANPENSNDDPGARVRIADDGNITCSNLNFHHAGRVDLLKDFNLVIPGGKVTALVGQSGCGKSTLAKLFAGLYELQSGNIRFGLFNLTDLELSSLRKQVVLVPQEPHFWSRSILDNFRFAYPGISLEKVVRMCQITMADNFISELPDKYQTVLGEFGANLSGGQKQRLAIARALIANPPILILDEATGALDPISESRLLDRLLEFRYGKTTILISHRPSVVQRANYILWLDKGELKLSGTPEELGSQPGDHLAFLPGGKDGT
ncbi:MAG: peptidase domain-containing ABC transporter [Synechococcus sp.]